jgi:hypothetical protein
VTDGLKEVNIGDVVASSKAAKIETRKDDVELTPTI